MRGGASRKGRRAGRLDAAAAKAAEAS